mgnify:FL=1
MPDCPVLRQQHLHLRQIRFLQVWNLENIRFNIVSYVRYGVYAMINKDERRDVSIRKPRPSIRKQLADSKQATSPKKAAARTKKNELEV